MIDLFPILLGNVLRFLYAKIKYGERYQSSCFERISSKSTIKLFDTGRCKLGRNIELAPSCNFEVHGNGTLSVGSKVYMNRGCILSCHNRVAIGDGSIFGPGVRIFDNNHKFSKKDGVSPNLNTGEIVIGRSCWVASNVIILKGANIGDNCVIGAGCIIDPVIPSGSLVRLEQNLIIEPIHK